MSEYIERGALEAESEVRKIKTPFAYIIVGGAAEKPCFSIMWWDEVEEELNIGYSSFNLDFVREWFRECFDVAEVPAADVVEVKHGRWKLNKDGSGTCNQCHFTQKNVWDMDRWQRYCGVCGALMDGGADNG